jgi:hypothetical protein
VPATCIRGVWQKEAARDGAAGDAQQVVLYRTFLVRYVRSHRARVSNLDGSDDGMTHRVREIER